MFRRRPPPDRAREIYGNIVRQARDETFYRDLGVPDTVDGRFEMLALHVFLVLRRLKGDERTGQRLFNVMFDDMDANLREMGAGDMGVGKRVKAMVEAFYGRLAAYDAALGGTDEALSVALARNLYRTRPAPPADALATLVRYVRRQDGHLGEVGAADLRRGAFAFAETPR